MIFKNHEEENMEENPPEYWMSFSDMMSSLLMIFILFLTLAMLQLTRQEEQLIAREDEVDKIIGVRQLIVEELRSEFENSNLDIDIDPETGAITFSDGVFFDYNEDGIKDLGREYLRDFIPQYIGVILNDKNRNHISEIIVEGHTDDQGSYMYNLELSQRRAFSVAKFILSDDLVNIKEFEKETLQEILTANGRSYTSPIRDSEGLILDDKCRRVEFKFRLRDEEMIHRMKEILGEDND